MQSANRVADVSTNTVEKLLSDAGEACQAFHGATVRGVHPKRVQCDEIWSFIYVKAKNVEAASRALAGAGDCRTWTALDTDTKAMIAWALGKRDASYANAFMQDAVERLTTRVQLTTEEIQTETLPIRRGTRSSAALAGRPEGDAETRTATRPADAGRGSVSPPAHTRPARSPRRSRALRAAPRPGWAAADSAAARTAFPLLPARSGRA